MLDGLLTTLQVELALKLKLHKLPDAGQLKPIDLLYYMFRDRPKELHWNTEV